MPETETENLISSAGIAAKHSENSVENFPAYTRGASKLRKYTMLAKERFLYLFFDCPPILAEFSTAAFFIGSAMNLYTSTSQTRYRLDLLNTVLADWMSFILFALGVAKLAAVLFGGFRFRALTSLASCVMWMFFALMLIIPPISPYSLVTFYLVQILISARNYWFLRRAETRSLEAGA
jgi:hypothetical protein